MSFDPGAQLDPGQIRDVRGRGRGGTLAVGGGGLGLVLAIAYILLGGDPSVLLGGGAGTGTGAQPDNSTLQQECKTGADAEQRADCRIVGYVNSIQEYWSDAVQRAHLSRRTPCSTTMAWTRAAARPVGRSGRSTARTTGGVPRPRVLRRAPDAFGARGGRFAEAYVVAHEYGHHIQNLLGTLQSQSDQAGQNSGRCGSSSRPTATPASGRNNAAGTGFLAASSTRWTSRRRSTPRRRSATTGSRRSPGPGHARDVDPRVVGAAPAVVRHGLRRG